MRSPVDRQHLDVLGPDDRSAVEHVSAALRRAVPTGRLGVAFSGGVD